jgi:hypothetical protein
MASNRTFFSFLITVFAVSAASSLAQPSVRLEIVPVFASKDSVVVAAQMALNSGTSFSVEAVYVSLAWDPGAFTADSIRLIKNRKFASNGWTDDCIPFYDHDGVYPEIAMYGEECLNFVPVSIQGTLAKRLCTFTFFPKSPSPGTTNFTIVGNTTTAATTGFYIPSSAENQIFAPVNELLGWYYDVELQSFSAYQQGLGVTITWRTATETNNSGFHVERRDPSVADGSWTEIAFVKGMGTSRQQQDYIAYDLALPHRGSFEYRLRQVDYDGTETVSRTIMVNYVDRPETFSLSNPFPNPASVSAGVAALIPYTLAERSLVHIVVTNSLGQEIATPVKDFQDLGSFSARWVPAGIPAGLYFVSMRATGMETGTQYNAVVKLHIVR